MWCLCSVEVGRGSGSCKYVASEHFRCVLYLTICFGAHRCVAHTERKKPDFAWQVGGHNKYDLPVLALGTDQVVADEIIPQVNDCFADESISACGGVGEMH